MKKKSLHFFSNKAVSYQTVSTVVDLYLHCHSSPRLFSETPQLHSPTESHASGCGTVEGSCRSNGQVKAMQPRWSSLWDPVAYKGCVVLLVTIAQLVSSAMDLALSDVEHAVYGVEWVHEKAEEKFMEGIVCACRLTIRGVTRLRKIRFRPSAVLALSLLSHLLALCGHILLLHYQGQWEN